MLTALRAACGLALAIQPSLIVVLIGIVSDWIDGPLARRAGPSAHGARADIEADSILTLGAAIGAARRGAPRLVLIGPIARYAVAMLRRGPLDRGEVAWDRATGVVQMVVLAAALAPWPVPGWRALVIPMSAARCAALLAQLVHDPAHAVD